MEPQSVIIIIKSRPPTHSPYHVRCLLYCSPVLRCGVASCYLCLVSTLPFCLLYMFVSIRQPLNTPKQQELVKCTMFLLWYWRNSVNSENIVIRLCDIVATSWILSYAEDLASYSKNLVPEICLRFAWDLPDISQIYCCPFTCLLLVWRSYTQSGFHSHLQGVPENC